MSAIWGMIDLQGQKIPEQIPAIMTERYQQYRIDRTEQLLKQDVYMACGLQYITRESHQEQLPYYDEQRDTFFTADCIIDNREELIRELGQEHSIPDGMLLYRAYLKWGEECSSHVLGTYAYAVYDRKHHKVMISADHTFSRCIFYHVRDNKVWFSTLLRPIYEAEKEYLSWNKRWLVDCMTLHGPVMITEPVETFYKNVYKIEAGTYITVAPDKVTRHCYWNPLETIRERHMSEEECRTTLQKQYTRCIKDILRSEANTGILLSSGLDSSSIACIAAPLLAERGQKLYSFTSVPEKGYESDKKKRYITDETEGVKAICKAYSNIEPEFVDYEGKTILTEYEELVKILELPTKSQQNTVWLKEIYHRAGEKNCKIVMNGQSGNNLISSGYEDETIYAYLVKGHIIKAIKEIIVYTKSNRFSRKDYIRDYLKRLKDTLMRDAIAKKADTLVNTCINREVADKYRIQSRFVRKRYNCGVDWISSPTEIRNARFDTRAFAQYGEYATKLGLEAGVVIRDPICSKRMIELFLQIPQEYYARGGTERRLVREYFRGIVPDEIILNTRSRGLQSADYEVRMKRELSVHREAYLSKLHIEDFKGLLDAKELQELKDILSGDLQGEISLSMRKLSELLTMREIICNWKPEKRKK